MLTVREQQHSFSTLCSSEIVEVLETVNVSTWGGLEPPNFGFMQNALTSWTIRARHLLTVSKFIVLYVLTAYLQNMLYTIGDIAISLVRRITIFMCWEILRRAEKIDIQRSTIKCIDNNSLHIPWRD